MMQVFLNHSAASGKRWIQTFYFAFGFKINSVDQKSLFVLSEKHISLCLDVLRRLCFDHAGVMSEPSIASGECGTESSPGFVPDASPNRVSNEKRAAKNAAAERNIARPSLRVPVHSAFAFSLP